MKTFIRISQFFGIAFVVTILLSIVQEVIGLNTALVSLPQFGPGLAALIMIRFFGDQITINVKVGGIGWQKWTVALTLLFAVPAVLFVIYSQFFRPLAIPSIGAGSFLLLLGGILVGAFGEELGWRGYAQQLLNEQWHEVISFVMVGFLWGIWHVGNFRFGLLYMLSFVVSTIGISAVVGWLLQGSHNSVILATLFHFAVNVGYFILQDALADSRLMVLNGLVWVGIAVLVHVQSHKKEAGAQPSLMSSATRPIE